MENETRPSSSRGDRSGRSPTSAPMALALPPAPPSAAAATLRAAPSAWRRWAWRVALGALLLAAAGAAAFKAWGVFGPAGVQASSAPGADEKKKEPAAVAVQKAEQGAISAYT